MNSSILKVVHICTHDSGGAFTAAYRIHQGMRTQKIDSKMLVLFQTKPQLEEVYSFLKLKKGNFDFQEWFLMHFYNIFYKILFLGHDKTLFSFHFSPFRVERCSLVKEADIINLHWVSGFINYPTFFKALNKKIYWTLHDLNPMLGGFHYQIYESKISARIKIIDNWILSRKKKILGKANFYTICPSDWILKKAELLGFGHKNRCFQCYYGIDTKDFFPKTTPDTRKRMKFDKNEILILFVAEQILDIRKGIKPVLESLIKLDLENVSLVTVGNGSVSFNDKKVYELGLIASVEMMCEIYSTCDFMIVPSLEDNLPNIIIEANLCGLPVIGLESSGIKEMIISGVNGYYMKNGDQMITSLEKMCKEYKKLNREEIVKFAKDRYDLSHIVKLYEEYYAIL